MPFINTCLFIASSPWASEESIAQVSLASFHNFTQNLMLIHCSKNRSLIFATRRRNTRLISATTSTQLALMHWNRKWSKLKHAQICLYNWQGMIWNERMRNLIKKTCLPKNICCYSE
jgi:uncharacterized protein YktB (UPF0637 family)